MGMIIVAGVLYYGKQDERIASLQTTNNQLLSTVQEVKANQATIASFVKIPGPTGPIGPTGNNGQDSLSTNTTVIEQQPGKDGKTPDCYYEEKQCKGDKGDNGSDGRSLELAVTVEGILKYRYEGTRSWVDIPVIGQE